MHDDGGVGLMERKPKTTPVRLTDEAIKWARIASGYTGESMAEFASRAVAEMGREVANRLHAKESGEKPTKGKGSKS